MVPLSIPGSDNVVEWSRTVSGRTRKYFEWEHKLIISKYFYLIILHISKFFQ